MEKSGKFFGFKMSATSKMEKNTNKMDRIHQNELWMFSVFWNGLIKSY